jgi:hypothetical protein
LGDITVVHADRLVLYPNLSRAGLCLVDVFDLEDFRPPVCVKRTASVIAYSLGSVQWSPAKISDVTGGGLLIGVRFCRRSAP